MLALHQLPDLTDNLVIVICLNGLRGQALEEALKGRTQIVSDIGLSQSANRLTTNWPMVCKQQAASY